MVEEALCEDKGAKGRRGRIDGRHAKRRLQYRLGVACTVCGAFRLNRDKPSADVKVEHLSKLTEASQCVMECCPEWLEKEWNVRLALAAQQPEVSSPLRRSAENDASMSAASMRAAPHHLEVMQAGDTDLSVRMCMESRTVIRNSPPTRTTEREAATWVETGGAGLQATVRGRIQCTRHQSFPPRTQLLLRTRYSSPIPFTPSLTTPIYIHQKWLLLNEDATPAASVSVFGISNRTERKRMSAKRSGVSC